MDPRVLEVLEDPRRALQKIVDDDAYDDMGLLISKLQHSVIDDRACYFLMKLMEAVVRSAAEQLAEVHPWRMIPRQAWRRVLRTVAGIMEVVVLDLRERPRRPPAARWLRGVFPRRRPAAAEDFDAFARIEIVDSFLGQVDRFMGVPRTAFRLDWWDRWVDILLCACSLSMHPHGSRFGKTRLIWKWASQGLDRDDGGVQWDDGVWDAEGRFLRFAAVEVIVPAVNYGRKPAAMESCDWQVGPRRIPLHLTAGERKTPRWLSLHQAGRQLPTRLDASYTRSLLVSGAVDQNIPLAKFVHLRVLDLDGWENLDEDHLSQQICTQMLVLRYLSLSNTKITRLPPEIKELRFLQALVISHTHISQLPPQVCELVFLKALDIRHTQIRQLPQRIVELGLSALLVGNGDDQAVASKIPEGIVRTRSLQTLATVDLGQCSASYVDALGALELLEELAITWSFHQCADPRYQGALRSSIQKWRSLKSLTIHCGLGCSMEFLASLSNPPSDIATFKVTAGRFVYVPQWIHELSHISFLQITVCKLRADDMEILGGLPKLECLVIGLDFIPKKVIVIKSKGWRRLQRFSIDCRVPWLTFKEKSMPRLTYLDMEICPSPPNQPSVPSGITNLYNLREVVLRYNRWYNGSSNVKMKVEAVKKAVAKHRRSIKLVINGKQHDFHEVHEEAPTEREIRRETEDKASSSAESKTQRITAGEVESEGTPTKSKIQTETDSKINIQDLFPELREYMR